MRSIAFAVWCLWGICLPVWSAEAPAATLEERTRIQTLIKQLGDDDFSTREAAARSLQDLAGKAQNELEAAAKSTDPEIQRRAAKLIPFAIAWKEEQEWAAAMAKSWPEALKQGKLGAPLLGNTGAEHASTQDDQGGAMPPPPNEDVPRDISLGWLSLAQEADGSFNGRRFGAQTSERVQMTASALLGFLGAGHTERVGKFKQNVQRAVQYLISCQREDGAIVNPGWRQVDGLAHELASLALSEAAAMNNASMAAEAVDKALKYSCGKLQSQKDGQPFGFGRDERSTHPDLLTTTVAIFHMKSAKFARLNVEEQAFNGTARLLDELQDEQNKAYRMIPDGAVSADATLIACAARQFLGAKRETLEPYVVQAVKTFKGPTTGADGCEPLVNWFGTLALFFNGGQPWKEWNTRMKENFINAQHKEGLEEGSWDSGGRWKNSGRIPSTALNILSLEVYYRYLPLYK